MIFNTISTNDHWIDKNDANTELSEIEIKNGIIYVPDHIYKDSLIDNDYLEDIMFKKNNKYCYDISCYNKIRQARIHSYNACIWYNEILDKIPTAQSIVFDYNSIEDAKSKCKKYIKDYNFVRTCHMSAKDINRTCIYNDSDTAINDLVNSKRTNIKELKCKHLFMRQIRNYILEVRCFWSIGKLRAVSFPEMYCFEESDKNEVLDFFNKYSKYFPYYSSVIDIGKTNNGYELIEFNTFGPDMIATSGKYSWREDWMTLIYSEQIQFL